ncbi:SHQ1 protein, partial [Campylorhamphus procurvoides]|nr:SHQ1 protein [Campylorhamphus procurvoides]
LQDEFSDVIDIKDPDQTPAEERRRNRLEAEAAKFDPDHYLADLFEDEDIQRVLKYKPWWVDAHEKMTALQRESDQEHDTHTLVVFSEEEKEQLRKFTNKSYLLDKRSRQHVYLGLIDILLAYCYDICVNEGDKNVESYWNIGKLSATLCWLETFTCINDVLVCFGRRVLCYPLYRHFGLVTRAITDTVMILQLGRAAVLKCLLDIHKIFRESDGDAAYILNDLFITDYCIWIQKVKSKKFAALCESLQKTTLSKSHLGLELEELEAAAVLMQEEGKAAGAVSKQQLLSSDSETSDSEESSSTSSSETEGSDSDEQESSTSKDGEINPLQGTLQEERTAPLTDGNGLRQGTNASALEVSDEKSKVSLQSASLPGKLIEELEMQMHSAMRLSEQPEGLAIAGCISQEQEENPAPKSDRFSEDTGGKGNFLEVPSKPNSLLFLCSTNEEED